MLGTWGKKPKSLPSIQNIYALLLLLFLEISFWESVFLPTFPMRMYLFGERAVFYFPQRIRSGGDNKQRKEVAVIEGKFRSLQCGGSPKKIMFKRARSFLRKVTVRSNKLKVNCMLGLTIQKLMMTLKRAFLVI